MWKCFTFWALKKIRTSIPKIYGIIPPMNFAITGGPSPILRDAALGFSSLRPLELQSQVVPSIPIPVQLCEGDAFSAHFFWEFLPTNQTWEGFRETRVPSPLKRGGTPSTSTGSYMFSDGSKPSSAFAWHLLRTTMTDRSCPVCINMVGLCLCP